MTMIAPFGLPEAVLLTDVQLQIRRALTPAEWGDLFFHIASSHRRLNTQLAFYAGDAWNRMLDMAGEDPAKQEAAVRDGMARIGGIDGVWARRIRSCAYVARRIPVRMRDIDRIDAWAIYEEVAPIKDAGEQAKLLDLYARGKIKREDIRRLKSARTQARPMIPELTPAPEENESAPQPEPKSDSAAALDLDAIDSSMPADDKAKSAPELEMTLLVTFRMKRSVIDALDALCKRQAKEMEVKLVTRDEYLERLITTQSLIT